MADLVSPITGKVFAFNEEVAEQVETISEDPYDEGWLIKVKLEDFKDVEGLMTAEEYNDYLTSLEEGEADDEESDSDEKVEDDVDEDDFV